ncbi:hypothetical protein GALL_336560 [mine drainage metagenome]|uniref:Uncharacterized protein n=1 Tax=mine drainage metagenome TaxID=410659 RepID=A0A1J5R472_9ZZZZ
MTHFRHGLRLRTERVGHIEDWLGRNARGGWDIRLDEVSDDLQSKSYMIFFERPDDLTGLKWALTLRGMPDLPGHGGKGRESRVA